MKIALQEGLLPGESLAEKLDFAESLAVEGLEVSGGSRLYDHVEQYEQALAGRSIKVASICGQETFDWLDPDPRKRANSLAETRRQLAACGHFQAVGQIVPPIFGPPRIPDLSPLQDAISLEKALLVELVKELAAYAASQGTLLLLEPLNRYEQHLLRRQADGVEIIERAGSPQGVALLSDFLPHAHRRNRHPGRLAPCRPPRRPRPHGRQHAHAAGHGRHQLARRLTGPQGHRL